jgi:hypothetical protein
MRSLVNNHSYDPSTKQYRDTNNTMIRPLKITKILSIQENNVLLYLQCFTIMFYCDRITLLFAPRYYFILESHHIRKNIKRRQYFTCKTHTTYMYSSSSWISNKRSFCYSAHNIRSKTLH